MTQKHEVRVIVLGLKYPQQTKECVCVGEGHLYLFNVQIGGSTGGSE